MKAFTSVITLAEILPKPIEVGNKVLAEAFISFIKFGINFYLIDISADIAELAGKLRGQYPELKTCDAIQIASAIYIDAEVFITNDKKLKQIKEIKVLVLKDYL